jgi:uncharacterized protein
MSAYPVFVHFNNLIHAKKTRAIWLLLLWLLVSIACRSAASYDANPVELTRSTATAASLVNQAGLTPIPIGAASLLLAPTETAPSLSLSEESGTGSSIQMPVAPIQLVEEVFTLTAVVQEEVLLPFQATPEPAQDPYRHLSIAYLLERSYGGGQIEIHHVMGRENGFTSYLFSYPSDDLVIYGFVNIPSIGSGPFPVVIALHGYVDPAVYNTLAYTTHYADTLAKAGFVVLHPNLRNYPPSSSGENLFRVGMAIDVLNLIAIMNEQAGQPGPFENAKPDAIGLWGHSMGGGISLRVSVVSPSVRAAVLYGAMSSDERQNFEAIFEWSDNQRGLEELSVPIEELERIAPIHFLERIRAAVSVHHGESDQMVPLQWSLDLCRDLIELGMEPECFTYPGQRHTFNQAGNQVFMERVIDFYKRRLEQ